MKYRILLLLAAIIWGFAFVAQIVGMNDSGPLLFNGIRLLIGAAILLPLLYVLPKEENKKRPPCSLWCANILLGIALFGGVTLQQIGLLYTTASKASFLTATYLIMVPIFGLAFRRPLRINHLFGILLTIIGVYFLSITKGLNMGYGDVLILLCALCFSLQIILLDRFTPYHSPVALAAGQFFIAGLLDFSCALVFEPLSLPSTLIGWWPILYLGIASTGIAYTLQAVGQKHVPPTEASMLLSMEMVFGGLSGILFLSETLTTPQSIGVVLMCMGVFLSQLPGRILFPRNSIKK